MTLKQQELITHCQKSLSSEQNSKDYDQFYPHSFCLSQLDVWKT